MSKYELINSKFVNKNYMEFIFKIAVIVKFYFSFTFLNVPINSQ